MFHCICHNCVSIVLYSYFVFDNYVHIILCFFCVCIMSLFRYVPVEFISVMSHFVCVHCVCVELVSIALYSQFVIPHCVCINYVFILLWSHYVRVRYVLIVLCSQFVLHLYLYRLCHILPWSHYDSQLWSHCVMLPFCYTPILFVSIIIPFVMIPLHLCQTFVEYWSLF